MNELDRFFRKEFIEKKNTSVVNSNQANFYYNFSVYFFSSLYVRANLMILSRTFFLSFFPKWKSIPFEWNAFVWSGFFLFH